MADSLHSSHRALGRLARYAALAGLVLADPCGAQNSVRMREMAEDSAPKPVAPVLLAVPASSLSGLLYRGDDDAALTGGAHAGCPADAFAYCEEMAGIARSGLARQWQTADEMARRKIIVSIDRATTDAGIDWSEAEAGYRHWNYLDDKAMRNKSVRKAMARAARGEIIGLNTSEGRLINCAVDGWGYYYHITGRFMGYRSRFYCW